MKNELSLRQSLQQKLTLKQKLGLELLVKNELQLEEYLKQEMNVNPLLEPQQEQTEALPEEHEEFNGFDENWSMHYNSHTTIQKDHDTHDFLIQQYTGEHDWRKTLHEEISLSNIPDFEKEILYAILEQINDEGFLEQADEILKNYNLSEEAFERLRTEFIILAPAGVGAYDEIESYKIQLRAKGVDDEEIIRMIDIYAKFIKDGNWDIIFQKEEFDSNRAIQLRHLFATLAKHPGYVEEAAVHYIIPDITVRKKTEGDYQIDLNEKYDALFTLNTYYVSMLENKSVTKNDRSFLMTYYNRYKTMREALEKRRTTLIRLAQYLIDFQRDFFDYGPKWIKPLTRNKVAEELGFNASTIVRAVQNKYLQTEYGIFPLAAFFAQSVSTKKTDSLHSESQKNVSRLSVLEALQDIIAKEDKHDPLTDEDIMDKLAKAGYTISRRAVNKYRGILKIPPRKERRI